MVLEWVGGRAGKILPTNYSDKVTALFIHTRLTVAGFDINSA